MNVCDHCKEPGTQSNPLDHKVVTNCGSDEATYDVDLFSHEDCRLMAELPAKTGLAHVEASQKILNGFIKRTDDVLIGYAVLGANLKQDLKNIRDLRAKMDAAGVAYR